jgi:hypothetical protein
MNTDPKTTPPRDQAFEAVTAIAVVVTLSDDDLSWWLGILVAPGLALLFMGIVVLVRMIWRAFRKVCRAAEHVS